MISPQPIRVMVVDKRPEVREGLEGFLESSKEFTPVGTATSGVQAIFQVVRVQPDIVLLGLTTSESHVAATISALYRACPHVHILTYCEPEQESIAKDSLSAGAIGYVLMDASADELRRALQMAHNKVAMAR